MHNHKGTDSSPRQSVLIPIPNPFIALSIRRIRPRHRCQLRLPLIPIRQQLFLIIQQLLPRLGRILGIRTLHNRIHRTTLLAEAAVNALRHVNIVAGGASAAVLALLGFDRDGLGRADGFAEFAGDAAFFARGVAAEGVFAPEAGADGALFEGVVDRVSTVQVKVRRYLLIGGDWQRTAAGRTAQGAPTSRAPSL